MYGTKPKKQPKFNVTIRRVYHTTIQIQCDSRKDVKKIIDEPGFFDQYDVGVLELEQMDVTELNPIIKKIK